MVIANPSTRSRQTDVLWLLAVLLGALLIRLLWLDADAARALTWSGAPFTDEGLYSHAARNRVLFGRWRTDGWDNRLVSPLFDGIAFIVYALFGVGYVQIRLISVGFAIVALLLFHDLIRRDLGPGWALLGAALWGFDYFWFQYSRLGLIEPSMVGWLVAAAWCWRVASVGRDRERGRQGAGSEHARRTTPHATGYLFACGICVGIAVVWKSLALVFVPVPLLTLLLLDQSDWRAVAGYLIGLGIVLAAYLIIWFVPNAVELARYNRFYAADRVPQSLAGAYRSFSQNIRSPYIIGQTPIVLLLALFGCAGALINWRRLPPLIVLCVIWLICGATLLIMPYSPPRYYTLLLPPLVVLAIYGLQFLIRYMPRSLATAMLMIALGSTLVWNGYWYARWMSTRQTTLIDSSREIGALVPPDEMIVGVAACGLSLANRQPCAPPFAGLANDDRPIETLGGRYAVVENNRDDYLRRFYPALLARSTVLGQFQMGPRRVTLYQLPMNNDQ